jgi:hypothetical protein
MGGSMAFRLKPVPALIRLDERNPPVGAGLLANAVGLVSRWRLDKCFRQQAGSYRNLHSASETNAAVGPAFARGTSTAVGMVLARGTSTAAGPAFARGTSTAVGMVLARGTSTAVAPALARVSGTGFSREAVALLLIFIRKKPRHRQTRLGLQAERRSRGVGRAAWIPREPPAAMDGGWRRAHGAGPE